MNRKTGLNRLMSLYVVFAMIFTAFAVISFVNKPVSASLSMSDVAGYWRFEENTGTTAAEQKTGDDYMTLTGTVTWVAGKIDSYAIHGDGSSGYLLGTVAHEDHYDFGTSHAFSVEMWYMGNLWGTYATLCSKGTGWHFALANGKFYFYDMASGWGEAAISNTTMPTSTTCWYHIFVTYDGSGTCNGFRFYLNATDMGHKVGGGAYGDWLTNTPFSALSNTAGSGVTLGSVDELVFYNRDLTPAEVTSRWNGGAGQNYLFGASGGVTSYYKVTHGTQTPANNTVDVSKTTASWTIGLTQDQGQVFNWTIQTSPNVGTASATFASNGTKSCTLTGLSYSTLYHVYVNTTPSYLARNWSNVSYHFTTEVQPSAPALSNEDPVNESLCQALDTDFNLDFNQAEGTGMNISMVAYNETTGSEDMKVNQDLYSGYTYLYGAYWTAQTFTLLTSGYITKVSCWATRSGLGGTFGYAVVGIRSASGSPLLPTGSDLVTAPSVYMGTWGSSPAWHDFTFTSPYYLTAGTYAVIMRNPGYDANRPWWWYFRYADPYTGGTYCSSANSGSTWASSPTVDATIRIYTYNYSYIEFGSYQTTSGYGDYNGTYTAVLAPTPLPTGTRIDVDIASHALNSNYTNVSYWFETGDNTPPDIGASMPVNGTIDVSTSLHWYVGISDDETTFNWTIQCGGHSSNMNGASNGNKYLNMTGLLYNHLYKVWVNVTDLSPGMCSPLTTRKWFTFTTIAAGVPYINWSAIPVTPVNLSYPDRMYINASVWILDPNGILMDYTFECSNGQTKTVIGASNGTIFLNLTAGILLSTSYTVWVNVTNGYNWTNGSRSFTTRSNAPVILGTPSIVNGTENVSTAAFVFFVPFTDADYPTYVDSVNCSIVCSHGDSWNGWLNPNGNIPLSITLMSYSTLYYVWVNTTDEWNNSVSAAYHFKTAPFGYVPPSTTVVHNTHLFFTFTNITSTLSYGSLTFSSQTYNGTSILMMNHYTLGVQLVINLSVATVGSYFTMNFVDATGYYSVFSSSFILVANNTYTILLQPVYPSQSFSNKWDRICKDVSPWETLDIWTDKTEYWAGEQIIIWYHLPSIAWFDATGKDRAAYYWVFRSESAGWFGNIVNSPDTKFYIPRTTGIDAPISLAYGYFEPLIIYANSAYLGTIPSGVKTYYMDFGKSATINDILTLMPSPTFKVHGTALTPTGSINSITPTYPIPNQYAYVNYSANNFGRLDVDDFLTSEANVISYDFNKPSGYGFETLKFDHPSTYRVRLYVSNGTDCFLKATNYVQVNGSNATSMGGNITYLQCSELRYISGYNDAVIYYNSMLGYANIKVVLPNGDTSMYGINTTTSQGIYRFAIPSFSQIGKWSVSMMSLHGLLSTGFYVVADENNYVEFSKNVYDFDESFVIWITKNVNCVLIFEKLDTVSQTFIPQGSRVYLQREDADGEMSIPRTYVVPSSGTWRIEMWKTDFRIPSSLLATYDVTVTVSAEDIPSGGGGSILPAMDPVIGAIAGLIITIFMTLSPFIVIRALQSNIDVPSLVYAMMGGLGVVISVLLGLFPSWAIPFILVVGVIISVLVYLMGKRGGGGQGV